MYSKDRNNGFSILDIIVRIIFAGLFIFILICLFQKKVPNMTTFYSSVFRENISYMQEAAESYFTDDKMPQEVNDTVKITLAEMIDSKIILPFVDKDGNECSKTESYVSITKDIDEAYTLKTNLVCNKESDFVLKKLGCHTYCKDNCNKTCQKEQIISYQYKKQMTGTKTTYSCPDGYKLDGKYCYRTVLSDTKSAIKITTKTNTLTKDAEFVEKTASKITTLETNKTSNKTYTSISKKTNKTYTDIVSNSNKVNVDVVTKTTEGTTSSKQVAYSCEKSKTERKCSTSYITSSYSCNCTGSWVKGQYTSVCSTCTESIPVETCNDAEVKYNDTCYKTETVTTEGTTTYSCPSGTTQEGTGSSTKCYKTETTYSCPTGYTQEGTGSTAKCYKNETTYSCPAGYTQEGTGSTAKCYKLSYSYSCPKEATATSGSGKYLKCYKAEKGSYAYECSDSSYKLNGTKCYKTVTEEVKTLSCDSGYTQDGETCKKYTEEKEKATSKTNTYTYYSYKWSKETSLSGWIKTGKTKTEEGEEVCK